MDELHDLLHGIDEERHADDRIIASLAGRQHGVVARRQLMACGYGRGAIDHRIAKGRLHRVHQGVYAVGYPRIAVRARWMAAVLACGVGALLSHQSAAALWGIMPTARSLIDISVPSCTRRARAGIKLHHVRNSCVADRDVLDGIPVTTMDRTLLDLAGAVDAARLARAVEEAERLRLLDARAVARIRGRGRRGSTALEAALAVLSGPSPVRSELERRFVRLCADAGLPSPAVNVLVAGFEVGALWPKARLVVELDGFAYHRTRAAFERDRARDASLQLAGFRVLRLTHRRLETEAATVVETLRSLLDGGR